MIKSGKIIVERFLLISAPVLQKFPNLSEFVGRIAIDLYDPIIFENIHYYLDGSSQSQVALNQQVVNLTNRLLRVGDFYLCGNQRQRDFWLGMLAANGALTRLPIGGSNYTVIDIVGIGIPEICLVAVVSRCVTGHRARC
jgi:hypothetical protein